MPISTFDIKKFVSQSILGINYLNTKELSYAITRVDQEDQKKTTPVIELLSRFIKYSTGSNPRSIKRLMNSLYLIKIMQQVKAKDQEFNLEAKIINFALVCIQVAYSDIYTLLANNPCFISWDNQTARDFRLPEVAEEKLTELAELEEFDEEWEQVLYRACQQNTFLSARAEQISKILNLIRELIPDNKDPEKFKTQMTAIVKFSAITNVSNHDEDKIKTSKHEYTIKQYRFSSGTKKLFKILDQRIRELSPSVMQKFNKFYIAYKLKTNFVDLVIQQKQIILILNMDFDEIKDPKGLCRDMTNTHQWGNGNVQAIYNNADQLEDLMDLIKQSFDKQYNML